MLVYAVNSRDSFDALTEFFELIERVRDCSIREVPIVLVGNKSDVDEDEWQVSRQEGAALAARMGCSPQNRSRLNSVRRPLMR